jgi:hypothetical protein
LICGTDLQLCAAIAEQVDDMDVSQAIPAEPVRITRR